MAELKTESGLEARIAAGEFAVTAEVGPPKSADGEVVRRKAAVLAGLVDAANVTDNQTAVVRLSSIAGALIAREAGVEPIVQVTCRDRNRIAIQSDLLGAYALGLRNVLAMTGDFAKAGNHPDAKDVFDLTTADLLRMLRGMRDEAKFLNGETMREAPRFFSGATSAPMLGPMDKELARLAERVDLGADFFQSQFVFDVPAFQPFMEQWLDRGLATAARLAKLAAALVQMVARHTIGRPKYAAADKRMQAIVAEAEDLGRRAGELMDADAEVYAAVARAFKRPKTDPQRETALSQ